MLNKWVALREKGNTPAAGEDRRRQRRPHLASECHHLADAERFRGQIIREITNGIAKIQNPALPEHEVRDLNDEINRKLREKWHWNKRILELGGLDFNALEKQRQMEQAGGAYGAGGSEGTAQTASVGGGYRYFGVAKQLPGVKEFLAKEEERLTKKSLQRDTYKNLTPDYYGWRDEEDGVLLELEALADSSNAPRGSEGDPPPKRQRTDDKGPSTVGDYLSVLLPNQEEMAQRRFKMKKALLLESYGL